MPTNEIIRLRRALAEDRDRIMRLEAELRDCHTQLSEEIGGSAKVCEQLRAAEAERDRLRRRSTAAGRALIVEIGAAGPENVDVTACRAASIIHALGEVARDAARHGCWEPAAGAGGCLEYYGLDLDPWCGACLAVRILETDLTAPAREPTRGGMSGVKLHGEGSDSAARPGGPEPGAGDPNPDHASDSAATPTSAAPPESRAPPRRLFTLRRPLLGRVSGLRRAAEVSEREPIFETPDGLVCFDADGQMVRCPSCLSSDVVTTPPDESWIRAAGFCLGCGQRSYVVDQGSQ